MRNLTEIEHRHGLDRWKDAGFIVAAAMLIALSVGSVSSKAAGKPIKHTWEVTVIESPFEVVK